MGNSIARLWEVIESGVGSNPGQDGSKESVNTVTETHSGYQG